MANEEHLRILKQGVDAWNKWHADSLAFRYQTLRTRRKDDLIGISLYAADLSKANLAGADLMEVNLVEANLWETDFNGARLKAGDLTGAHLVGATLTQADLTWANFRKADLNRSSLRGADLRWTNFNGTNLRGADFTDATVGNTTFSNVDLSEVKGLDYVSHHWPSTIGIDTIYKSKGKIPELFLRGCGVPENFIRYMHSLAGDAFEFYSCFISYSSRDHDFATRLHADLQSQGVRCWFAPEDLKIGAELRTSFDEAIRVRDKLMVLLSKDSIESRWVEDEVEAALEEERRHNKTVLFPINLDNAVMETDRAWAAKIRRTRHVGDFCAWKDHDSYKQAFERLLRDLRSSDKPRAAGAAGT